MSRKPHHLVRTLRDLAKEQSAMLADLLQTAADEIEKLDNSAELDTERELRLCAEGHYKQLLAFISGTPPEKHSMHVKGDYERAWQAFIDKTADKAGF